MYEFHMSPLHILLHSPFDIPSDVLVEPDEDPTRHSPADRKVPHPLQLNHGLGTRFFEVYALCSLVQAGFKVEGVVGGTAG